MIYHSTRDKEIKASSKEAVLKGLCDDGGLFVSDSLSQCRVDVEAFKGKSYIEIAEKVFGLLLDDYSAEEIHDIVSGAYIGSFENDDVAPVSVLSEEGREYMLELWHGPTCAFKDVALMALPRLMSKALAGSGKKILIVTATSGDTGKAALEGFKDVPGIGIIVFYPEGGVSDIQYLQMATQEGKNVKVCSINGNFDDAQSAVKRLFSSPADDELQKEGIYLSSANSINIGRLIPQTVYYFYAYARLRETGSIAEGEKIDFCVPTGNFGDVLAGYYAKLMGLPVRKLIVASNSNKVLTDFIETGIYDKNRNFLKTISPSMDILISSNLERMLYYMSEGDCLLIRELMSKLAEEGKYELPAGLLSKIREVFSAGYADEGETRAAIKKAYDEYGRVIDTHTAVGLKVMQENRAADAGTACVLLSTASPYKFCKDVYKSVFGDLGFDDSFSYMEALSEKTGTKPPVRLEGLKEKPVLHRDNIDPKDMEKYVFENAGRLV